MSGFVDQFPQIARQVAAETQPVACDRVNETKHRGMERLAVEIEPLEYWPDLRVRASI
jgi:hypothetical protein